VGSVALQRIGDDEAVDFAPLLPTRHRERARTGALAPDLVLVGSRVLGRPVAAGLVQLDTDEDSGAVLESLYVVPALRGQGRGTQLLRTVVGETTDAGASALTVLFPNAPGQEPVHAMLRTTGWDEPVIQQRQFEADGAFRAAPRLAEPQTVQDAELIVHADLTATDRAQIAVIAAQIPAGLDPLRDEDQGIPEACIYLRHDGEIVGWSVHRWFAPGTSVLTTAWVHPRMRGASLGSRLGCWSIGRALDHGQERIRFVVHVDNAPMLRIIERDVLPYGVREVTLYQTTRRLAGAMR